MESKNKAKRTVIIVSYRILNLSLKAECQKYYPEIVVAI